MKNILYVLGLCCSFLTSLYSAPVQEESAVWLIQEEFIKFGKKDAYESLQQSWLQGFQKSLSAGGFWRTKNSFGFIYGLQALEEPQYIYLIPLKDTAALSDFLQKRSQYNESLSPDAQKQRQMLLSALNFSISSLHRYLSDCSRLISLDAASWEKNPYIHYWVYGITPGNEQNFEQYLQKLVVATGENQAGISWRTWRVMIGADTPKYVIVLSAPSEEVLEARLKQISFVDGSLKDILRSQREGEAVLKETLSLTAMQ